MEFFAMKRKKLQSLCKKHGIPANLKNKEMAEKLSFIYKGKEDTDDGKEKGGTFDSVNVGIIDLESESDDEPNNNVQMEAPDIAVGIESDAEGKMIAEHFLEVKSSDPEIHEMVASDSSEVEGNIQEGVHKEKVDDENKELHLPSLSSDAHVVSGEFGNCLVDGEVEKLSEKTSDFEDTSEPVKVGNEDEKQDHNNSLDVSLLHVSLKESSVVTGLVEEANKLDENENISGHGAIYKDCNISEASAMCFATSIGAKDTDGKTNVTVEDVRDEVNSSSFEDSDGTPVQFSPTDPLGEVNASDLDAHKMVATDSGTDTRSADTFEAQKISVSPASEKMIESSSKLISNTETAKDDMGLCDVDENMQIGINDQKVDHIQEVLHAEPSLIVMKDDDDLQQVASQALQVADMEIYDMEENMQIGVNKEQVDHSQEVLHTKPSVVVMNEDHVQVGSEDIQVDDMGFCDMEENLQIGVNEDLGDHSQEALHAEPSLVVIKDIQVDDMGFSDEEDNMQISVNEEQANYSREVLHSTPSVVVTNENHVQVASKDIQVDDMGFSNVEENVQIGVNEDQGDHSQDVLHAEPSVVIMKDIQVDDMGFSDEQKNIQIGVNEDQGDDHIQEDLHPGSSVMVMKDEDFGQVTSEDIQVDDMRLCNVEENMQIGTIRQMDALDTCEGMLKSSQKTGLVADQEACIGNFPNNLEASMSKDFETETYFDISTLGDVVVNCSMDEIMQSDKMEKENSHEECNFNRLFENSDAHDDTNEIGAEDENQSYMMSHKRKRSDVDDTNGLDSDEKEKADEFVPTMPQFGEMESCNFNLHQIFASGTSYGEESICNHEKLESPPKGTPIETSKKSIIFSPKIHVSSMTSKGLEIETSFPLKSARDIVGSDMKENIKIDKKDQVGSIMPRSKIAKRQPLQDLQQN